MPKAHIPLLTPERAEEISGIAMEEAFGPEISPRPGKDDQVRARRQGAVEVRRHLVPGPERLLRQGLGFYAIRHNVVLAGVHYTVNWVDDQCYFHSGHPQSCKVQTKRK